MEFKDINEIPAISYEDYSKWGCPNCGCSKAFMQISTPDSQFATCAECGEKYWVQDEAKKGGGAFIDHPRKGIPRHTKVKSIEKNNGFQKGFLKNKKL